MIIHPEIYTTPDTPTVKFREPMENINLDLEISKILNAQGWGLGTNFNVQFVDHEKTKLIASGQFVVTEENESLQTSNADGHQPMTKMVSARKAVQVGDWFYPKTQNVELVKGNNAIDALVSNTPTDIVVKWNPGLKVFQVKEGDKVVFQDADKSKAEEFRDAA